MVLSILIAAHNVERFISKCVASCLDDSIPDDVYEIVVTDDGSNDGTALALDSFKNHPKVRVIRQENGGLGAARNAGLEAAKGRFLWFIDGDDYLEPDAIGRIIAELEKGQADVLLLDYNIEAPGYKKEEKAGSEGLVVSGPAFYRDHYYLSYTWRFVFRKTLFENPKVRFQPRINMQDAEILPKLLLPCDTLLFSGITGCNYVQHPGSFTNSADCAKRLRYFESIIAVRDSLSGFLQNKGNAQPEMKDGLEKKLRSLHTVVHNHVLYFHFDRKCFAKVISLLSANGFYPLVHRENGWKRWLAAGVNVFPNLVKPVFNFYLFKKA